MAGDALSKALSLALKKKNDEMRKDLNPLATVFKDTPAPSALPQAEVKEKPSAITAFLSDT